MPEDEKPVGRPRGKDYPKRVYCYVSEEDEADLKRLAKARGLPVATLVRQLIRRALGRGDTE